MPGGEFLTAFQTEISSCGERLSSELKECWRLSSEILTEQLRSFAAASTFQPELPGLASLNEIFSTYAQKLIAEPVARYRRERPQLRAQTAFDDWDKSVEAVIRSMPEHVSISKSEWNSSIGSAGTPLSARLTMTSGSAPVRVPFRRNLLFGFHRRRLGRRKVEGAFLMTLAQAGVELLTPWEAMLQIWLPCLLREPSSGSPADLPLAERRLASLDASAERELGEIQTWLSDAAVRIANVGGTRTRIARHEDRIADWDQEYFRYHEFWNRQSRAVESSISLATRLASTENALVADACDVLGSVQREREDLMDELNRVVGWLEKWKHGDSADFPAAQAEIRSTADRLILWQHTTDNVLQQVPEAIEVSPRLRRKPVWRHSWKTRQPEALMRDAMDRETKGVIQEGLDEVELGHQGVVRQIERAREVVAFARETARDGQADGLTVEQEGIENAKSLLQFHRKQIGEVPPELERALASGLAAAFLRTHTRLEKGELGVIQQAAKYGFPAAIRTYIRSGVEWSRESSADILDRGARSYRELLIRIGWLPAPTARLSQVVTRGYLTKSLGADFRVGALPMIYQRLFRLDPVEDSRFLIGRQNEMRAIAAARSLWEENRESAVIIVGERGSGKTSLINCALQSALAGPQVILRGEFSQRLTQADDMRRFLADLLGTRPEHLETDLNERRRIIVLEELERTFLRRINHYGAVKSLLNLIARTSRNTLWLLSTNYFSFRLLNASLRMDPYFSHRINAMAVDPEYLREAILMRHNLSGLRLRFAPPTSPNPYADRLTRFAGVERDPESQFFDMLYTESGGVFRTAFALWQRHIDRSEAGIVYMRHPAPFQIESIIKSLNDLDLFTLAAILQHGSLTPAEHSLIFQIDQNTSNAWLANLLALELVEQDPRHPGLRVLPEAGEIVRRTLFRRNVA
jgi:hypothetical protein